MKKIVILLVVLMVLSLAGSAYATSSLVTVLVNGQKISFPDQQPFIQDGRTLVPVRFVSEALGAKVDWDQPTQTAIINKDGSDIRMKIGSMQPVVNGYARAIDVPAQLVNNRTMVPLRFVSEILGAHVEWISATQTVDITTTGTWSSNGYTIPVQTGLKVEPGEANDPNKVDIAIGIVMTNTISQQYEDAHNILQSKFGMDIANQIINYAKTKKDPYDDLKIKDWRVNGQLIRVGSNAGDPSVAITVWKPGV